MQQFSPIEQRLYPALRAESPPRALSYVSLPATCLSLLALTVAAAGADAGVRAEYVGGTLASLPNRAQGAVLTADPHSLEFRTRQALIRVPYESINLLEYGQNVNRRLALAIVISPMFLLSKKRDHFLTIGYAGGDGLQQAIVLRVEKRRVRALLASLEARTGRRVEFQDDEARKAGRG